MPFEGVDVAVMLFKESEKESTINWFVSELFEIPRENLGMAYLPL